MAFATAASFVLILSGCNTDKVEPERKPAELTVNAVSRNMTRGYVPGTAFEQVVNPSASPAETAVKRDLVISAYNVTDDAEYFTGFTFKYISGNGVWSNFEGDTHKPIYWPLDNTLDFLAYSQSNGITGDGSPKIKADWSGARKVTLKVTAESTQDDILYAAANGMTSASSSSTSGFSMQFYHAQAWVTFNLKVASGCPTDVLKINAIEWQDIYSSGELTITNKGTAGTTGAAEAEWDFFSQCAGPVCADDLYNVLESPVGTTASRLDMLLPAQKHSGLIINYTMGEKTGHMRINADRFTNTGTVWEMGRHYTYSLTFTVSEISIAPTVTLWDEVAANELEL